MSSPILTLITTEDGSKSIHREDLDETYHSTRGAMGESKYVFIEKGLQHYYEKTGKRKINILEIGLGTGLNALLTAMYAMDNQLDISYFGLEPFPVPYAIYNELDYGNDKDESTWIKSIHSSKWEEPIVINDHFKLTKSKIGLEDYFNPKMMDVVYFDAFAPSKQAALWAVENLRKCYEMLVNLGLLTTYCAQGQFKRNMAEVGFEVETLEGALGKKEMVRGVKK